MRGGGGIRVHLVDEVNCSREETELNTKNSNEHRNRTKEHGLVALVKLNRAIAELTGDYALKLLKNS